MADYNTLVYKLGSLHTLLRELESAGLYQGEHTIQYKSSDGARHTLHVYIDGTELQLGNTPGNFNNFDFSADVFSGED